MPRATLLVLALVAAAEASARWAVAHGKLTPDLSANRLIAEHVQDLRREKPAVWLLGNSTLYAGVDVPVFAAAAHTTAARLELGSASVRASAALLGYYLRHAPQRPTAVVLLVSKDDLNANGYRADVSRRILHLADGDDPQPPTDYLVLCQAKQHIVDKAVAAVDRALTSLHLRGRTGGEPGAVATHVEADGEATADAFDGHTIAPKLTGFLQDLMAHYAVDDAAIAEFAAVAHRAGVRDVTIVYMPATDTYARYHDAHVRNGPTWNAVKAKLAADCAADGIRFIDCSGPRTDYAHFQDPYHLNAAGNAAFTPELAARYLARS